MLEIGHCQAGKDLTDAVIERMSQVKVAGPWSDRGPVPTLGFTTSGV